jgi:hypothetical protein
MAVPEDIGTLPRRARLMAAAMLKIASLQVSQPRAYGTPLGDGSGLEDVVAVIRPLFAREPSLTRWVAIRGALLFLDIACEQPSVKAEILVAMGPQADEETVRLAPARHRFRPRLRPTLSAYFILWPCALTLTTGSAR